MSTSSITVTAVCVSVAAMLVLLLSDIRQDARVRRLSGRARREPAFQPVETEGVRPTRLYRRPSPLRKLLSLFEMGAITVAVGAFIGTAIGVVLTLAVLLLRSAVK